MDNLKFPFKITYIGLVFLKLTMRIVYENTILVFSENYSCFINLVFYVLFVFFRTKKKIETRTYLVLIF